MGKRVISHPVEFYKTFWKMEWRWRIKAKNGNVIASASEGYKNKADCVYNAKSTAASINKFFKDEKKAQEYAAKAVKAERKSRKKGA